VSLAHAVPEQSLIAISFADKVVVRFGSEYPRKSRANRSEFGQFASFKVFNATADGLVLAFRRARRSRNNKPAPENIDWFVRIRPYFARFVTITTALRDPNLLGAALGNADSWDTWIAVLKAAFGLTLNRQDRRTFAAVAGSRRVSISR
jgi:hypothetical protein